MSLTGSQFIIKRWNGFGGNFIDSQYLGASYDAGKPHVFQNTLMRVFSSKNKFFHGKFLSGMAGVSGSGGIKEIESEIYRWTLQGADVVSARIVETIDAANTTPGLNGDQFRIKLDLDYYEAPDVILPEDNDYPIQILTGPQEEGGGYIYTCQLETDDHTAFLPVTNIEVGREFDKSWTTIASEYNDEGGTQQYPASFKLESQVGAFAQKLTVTDKAWRKQGMLDVEFMYENAAGQDVKVNKFLPMAEAKMHDELMQSMEVQYWLGKRSTKQGPNKYWKKTGPGLRQQLQDGFIEYYNGALTTTRVKDYLLDIFFARTDEESRDIVAVTGTLGSLMFHDMLAAEASSFLTVDTNFVARQPGKAKRLLSFGAQFTHYQGPEGISVTLVKNPLYDSRRYSKRMHPVYTEIPIDSARMTFLDFGTSNGENNIQILRVKDSFSFGYIPGTHTPSGPIKGGVGGAFKAGYDMWTQGTGGIWMKDATRGGELIFDSEF